MSIKTCIVSRGTPYAGQVGAAHGGLVLFFAVGGLSLLAAGAIVAVLFLLGYALEPSAEREWARKRADLRQSVERMRVEDGQ